MRGSQGTTAIGGTGTRRPSAWRASAATLVAVLALAPAAGATHRATDFSLTPADPTAGASVNASSSTSLAYDNLTEDVKKTIGHFAPGLLANPEAVPHCPQPLYLADACPADTRIGSAEAQVNGLVIESGRIYNQELLADEAGRLGIIVDSASGKLFLTAPFYVRTGGDFGLDGILDDIPRLTPGTQITRLSFTLFGTVNGRNFTRGPTSCSLKVSTGEAFGYEHTASVSGPASSYTPTECDKLPFKPTFDMSVASSGETGFNDHPSLRVTVTQQQGEAGVLDNTVTLPTELTPDTASFKVLCSETQLGSGGCPAGSKVGDANATSPFLATPLAGPVWLVQKTGSVLPTLVADLRGRVPIKIDIQNAIVGGRQVRATTSNVPDLPIGSFSLALKGGPGGVLLNKADLCLRSASTFRDLRAAVGFTGQNGASISSSPRIRVEGCPPAASGSLRRARSRKPRLTVSVRSHPDGQKLKAVDLVLPRELRFPKRRAQRGASVNAAADGSGDVRTLRIRGARRLHVSGMPQKGATRLVVKLRRGAVRATGKLRRALRKRTSKRVRLKIVTTDGAGKRSTIPASVRARR